MRVEQPNPRSLTCRAVSCGSWPAHDTNIAKRILRTGLFGNKSPIRRNFGSLLAPVGPILNGPQLGGQIEGGIVGQRCASPNDRDRPGRRPSYASAIPGGDNVRAKWAVIPAERDAMAETAKERVRKQYGGVGDAYVRS